MTNVTASSTNLVRGDASLAMTASDANSSRAFWYEQTEVGFSTVKSSGVKIAYVAYLIFGGDVFLVGVVWQTHLSLGFLYLCGSLKALVFACGSSHSSALPT